jgi:hypothetical protein
VPENRPIWNGPPEQPPQAQGGPSWQPPGGAGQPPLPPLLPPRKSWPARHKVWTAVIGVVGVLVVLGVIGTVAGPEKPTASVGALPASTKVSSSPTPSPTPTNSPPPARLTSTASLTRKHPRTGTKVGVQVFTAPGARIWVVAHFEAGDREKMARADATGLHTFWFPLGSAPPGIRVRVTVRVSAHGQKRFSRVWFTPRQPPPPPAPKITTAPPAPSGCYPKTSSGNCYEPGEFCPHADAGMSGIAGNGEAIICEDNNGLRWELA